MELNFEEINNYQNSYQNYDNKINKSQNVETQKYWEEDFNQKQKTQLKKKKVTFSDILNNMNLVVNNQGVLQFMAPINQTEEQPLYPHQQNQYSHQQNPYQNHTKPKLKPYKTHINTIQNNIKIIQNHIKTTQNPHKHHIKPI